MFGKVTTNKVSIRVLKLIGVLIQQARQEKGLTQEQVAELAGTNKSYFHQIHSSLSDSTIVFEEGGTFLGK